MDMRQMQKYKEILIQLRGQILQKMDSEIDKEPYSERSGEHPLASHLADNGADFNEYEKSYLLASMEGDVLKKIDDALIRIDEGTFGQCVVCGAEINPKRLEAVPYARLCVECKEKEEKGLL